MKAARSVRLHLLVMYLCSFLNHYKNINFAAISPIMPTLRHVFSSKHLSNPTSFSGNTQVPKI